MNTCRAPSSYLVAMTMCKLGCPAVWAASPTLQVPANASPHLSAVYLGVSPTVRGPGGHGSLQKKKATTVFGCDTTHFGQSFCNCSYNGWVSSYLGYLLHVYLSVVPCILGILGPNDLPARP